MIEAWYTPEQIARKQAEFEAALGPAWKCPAAWGVLHESNGKIVVDRANPAGRHAMAAAVLATVLGHRGGTAVLPLNARDLDRAISMQAPAEACTAFEHPNLAAWRRLRAALKPGRGAVAVFAESTDIAGSADPFLAALLDEARRIEAAEAR
jgi:hypothetical protein